MNKDDIERAIDNLEEQILTRNKQDKSCINWLGYANLVLARSALLKELECLEP
jgi:hypothetical protein